MKYYTEASTAALAAMSPVYWGPGPQGLMKALRRQKGRQQVYRITVELIKEHTAEDLNEIKAFKRIEHEKKACPTCDKIHVGESHGTAKKRTDRLAIKALGGKKHISKSEMAFIEGRPLPRESSPELMKALKTIKRVPATSVFRRDYLDPNDNKPNLYNSEG